MTQQLPQGARIWFAMPAGLEFEVWLTRFRIYQDCPGWKRAPQSADAQANAIGFASR